jgi:excinuclease ABC subunit A
LLYGHPEPLHIKWSKKWGKNITQVDETRLWHGIVATVEGWKARTQWLREHSTCSVCKGGRLQPALLAVRIGGQGVAQVVQMTVGAALEFWSQLELEGAAKAIAEQAIQDLSHKLAFLKDVGLGYLTLDRTADTLSGGEAQRIRLATQLGARLTGTIYVLDEPTVGLHPRDTKRLLRTLHELRDLGNTLVVVEHDPDVMRAADHVIDMGPGAGEHGGWVMAEGTLKQIASADTPTGDYLSGRIQMLQRGAPRTPKLWVEVPPAHLHNLKGFSSRFPRRCLTVVTGVSGSGKSTLVMDILAPLLEARRKARKAGPRRIVVVDQRPIGRSPRSTPATYAKVLGPIRALFAQTQLARTRGYGPGRFTFNGRKSWCPVCEGRGAILVEMHFLSDVWLPCEGCGGTRFNEATLQVKWRDHTIADVLALPIEDALVLFGNHRGIARRLQALADVGLGYLRLGQPANTLSGGEAQRLKLATELLSQKKEACFLLDEPTTGLHLADVDRLLRVLHRLVDAGHMIVVIEHHLDVIRSADHIIDLGPDGGEMGGEVVVCGTPTEIAACASSLTGAALTADQCLP